MGKLFTINLEDSVKSKLAEAAGRLTEAAKVQMQQATRTLAEMSYNRAVEIARTRLDSTALAYIEALHFEQVGPGVFSVSLDQSADWLENGMSSHDLRTTLLKNAKKVSKLGFKYRSIPFEHKDNTKQPGSTGNLMGDLKLLRKGLGDRGITKDSSGQPLLGKIWGASQNDAGLWELKPGQQGVEPATARFVQPGVSDRLNNIQKFQYAVKGRGGKDVVKSAFISWRTISERPGTKGWIHPGVQPYRILQNDTYQFAMESMSKILDEIFKGQT